MSWVTSVNICACIQILTRDFKTYLFKRSRRNTNPLIHCTLSVLIWLSYRSHIGHFPFLIMLTTFSLRHAEKSSICFGKRKKKHSKGPFPPPTFQKSHNSQFSSLMQTLKRLCLLKNFAAVTTLLPPFKISRTS